MIEELQNVKFSKSIIFKGRIAPKGLIFFIAKGSKKTVWQLVNRQGATEEQENICKTELIKCLSI